MFNHVALPAKRGSKIIIDPQEGWAQSVLGKLAGFGSMVPPFTAQKCWLVEVDDRNLIRRIALTIPRYLDPPPELDEITEAIQAFIANLSTW